MIINGDCLLEMAKLPENSVDSIVTDPPYGISFMGKDWDHGVPGEHFWKEALRVAKPGAHLLAFGGTRTFHRLAVAIEDAGWEIRDCVMWVYGSAMPKSLNVGKSIDKQAGAKREKIGDNPNERPNCTKDNTLYEYGSTGKQGGITAPATEGAKKWDGWGTALKPAWEPIIVARKPFEGTVAENVLKYGTGAFNIDECRVPADPSVDDMLRITIRNKRKSETWEKGSGFKNEKNQLTGIPQNGRFPANLIHDGSKEVTDLFPEAGNGHWSYKPAKDGGIYKYGLKDMSDGGSERLMENAARFFYVAKASREDRDEGCEKLPSKEWKNEGAAIPQRADRPFVPSHNNHPTVKPTTLMRYLCRLVTPPNGTILDPFMGTGSTGKAAKLDGFKFIGIEINKDYCEIAKARIQAAKPQKTLTGEYQFVEKLKPATSTVPKKIRMKRL